MNGSAYVTRTECPIPSREQCLQAMAEASVAVQQRRAQGRSDEDETGAGAA